MNRFSYLCIVLLAALLLNTCANEQYKNKEKAKNAMDQEQVVVFVCEHGSAKSIIAAAHFNKLAGERKMNLRAIARGTNPDEELSPKTIEGLRADGLTPSEQKPKKLSNGDIVGVARVVTFCQLPEDYYKAVTVEEWTNVPPVSQDYDKARDAMVERINHLLDEMKQKK
jgi:protein-tyrosine-phosphatase